jgi:hypothetical protein
MMQVWGVNQQREPNVVEQRHFLRFIHVADDWLVQDSVIQQVFQSQVT